MTRALLVLSVALAGCPSDPCAGVIDLGGTPRGLELTRGEHPGWGRTACFQCHQIALIHRSDCLASASVDVAAIDDAIDVTDTSTCVPCHGANGVPEWEPQDSGGAP